MKVLVTGASGFVGKHLMERNPNFIGVDLRGNDERVMLCDITNSAHLKKVVSENAISIIIHLAGRQYTKVINRREREDFFQDNVIMAESIANLSQEQSVEKIIYVSTDMVYGNQIESPVVESHKTIPIGPYGRSKLKAEEILGTFYKEKTLVIFRPRLVLGVGRLGTLEKLASLIKSHLPIILVGRGRNRYQCISVIDLCAAIEKAVVLDVKGVMNLGSDNPPSVYDLMKGITQRLDVKKSIIRTPPRLVNLLLDFLDIFGLSPLAPEQYKLADVDYVLDTNKAKMHLEWNPEHNDEEVFAMTLSHILQRSTK